MARVAPKGLSCSSGNICSVGFPCGLFHSHYVLPVGRVALEITLELAPADAVAMKGPLAYAGADVAAGAITGKLSIQNVRLLCDTTQFDSAMNDNIDEALLQGMPLSLSFSS